MLIDKNKWNEAKTKLFKWNVAFLFVRTLLIIGISGILGYIITNLFGFGTYTLEAMLVFMLNHIVILLILGMIIKHNPCTIWGYICIMGITGFAQMALPELLSKTNSNWYNMLYGTEFRKTLVECISVGFSVGLLMIIYGINNQNIFDCFTESGKLPIKKTLIALLIIIPFFVMLLTTLWQNSKETQRLQQRIKALESQLQGSSGDILPNR